jgi:hypothetical protein
VPAPTFKTTWTFSSTNGGTWSEVWYRESADIAAASTFPQTFLNKRLKLLHQINYLEKIRVTSMVNPRLASVVNIRQPGLVTLDEPYPVQTAAVCIIKSTLIPCQRKWWCRGIGRVSVARDATTGRDVVGPVFATDLATWFSALNVIGYVILPQFKPGQGGVTLVATNSVDGTSNSGYSTVTTFGPHGLAPADFAQFGRQSKKDLPGLNGRFVVWSAPTATTFSIQYRTPENQNIITQTGYVKKYSPNFGALIDNTKSGFDYLGEHKSKNESTGSRGARSAVRVRTSA